MTLSKKKIKNIYTSVLWKFNCILGQKYDKIQLKFTICKKILKIPSRGRTTYRNKLFFKYFIFPTNEVGRDRYSE